MAFSIEIQCLANLGAERGLFTLSQVRAVAAKLNQHIDLVEFAQHLIDNDVVTEVESLEELLDVAQQRAAAGAPLHDPFTPKDGAPVALKLASRNARAAVAASAPAVSAVAEEDPPMPPPPKRRPANVSAGPATKGGLPSFPFHKIELLEDEELFEEVQALLQGCARAGASDLHLSTGARPFIRQHRQIVYISDHSLSAQDALKLNTILLNDDQVRAFLEAKDLDYALSLGTASRYRVNLMYHREGMAGNYHMVPERLHSLAGLGYTAHLDTLERMLSYHNGLILVTGPVGAGKTTTLASMVNYLNETRTDHIITVEDPIEIVQPARGCNVTQREVGPHTKSFHSALKGALREDPDVIVIGELRDLETIEMAISASETGHLVIGTMHTSDAATTLNRLLDVFPPAQQTQVRTSVADSLRGIVCQRLLPATDHGLVLACEILISNPAIQNLIREGKGTGLRNTMETGVRDGMCLMDNTVFRLFQEGKISPETARANIANKLLRTRIQ